MTASDNSTVSSPVKGFVSGQVAVDTVPEIWKLGIFLSAEALTFFKEEGVMLRRD